MEDCAYATKLERRDLDAIIRCVFDYLQAINLELKRMEHGQSRGRVRKRRLTEPIPA